MTPLAINHYSNCDIHLIADSSVTYDSYPRTDKNIVINLLDPDGHTGLLNCSHASFACTDCPVQAICDKYIRTDCGPNEPLKFVEELFPTFANNNPEYFV